ncbi:YesL family protein [Thermicanus aegyptius]|uniref:YesL family protein n=1 Tax=Thermicanus aegyptius TaxID=94009 RepID=UPI0003F8C73B|nr:DUF624 domain-containing protein [Thermicanus aegyptius]
MEQGGFMGGLYRISEWIMRLSALNLLWIFTAFPFFFLVLLLLSGPPSYPPVLFWMGLLSPIFFFPSTAASFAVARKWVIGQEDVPLFRTFFRGYKENYGYSFLGGCLYLLAGLVLGVNFYFYWQQPGLFKALAYVTGFLLLFLITSLPFFFSSLVHFQVKFWTLIKNSLLITLISPLRALSLLLISLVLLFISVFYFTFLLAFFTGSLLSLFSYWIFHKNYLRLTEKEGGNAEKSAEGQGSLEPQETLDKLRGEGSPVNPNQEE